MTYRERQFVIAQLITSRATCGGLAPLMLLDVLVL